MARRLLRVLGLFVAAGLAAGAPARAEGPGRGHDGPCRPDVERHCASAERGGGGIGRCLREHEKDLSPACRDHLAARHEQMKKRADAVYAACKTEAAKHCPDHEPGEGGLIRCLRDHEADLSKECRAALPERRRP
jgi:hypothetical protein